MELSTQQVDACFHGVTNQQDWMLNLYKLVFEDWARITKVNGFPKIGETISKYIWDKAINFDKKYHPSVLAGGAWMNQGFSTDKTLGPFEVSMKGVTITY